MSHVYRSMDVTFETTKNMDVTFIDWDVTFDSYVNPKICECHNDIEYMSHIYSLDVTYIHRWCLYVTSGIM